MSHAATNGHGDTARRHSTTCPQKRGRLIPPPRKRGRKLKACDACALAKEGCDGGRERPCSLCLSRRQTCTFGRAKPGKVDCPKPSQPYLPTRPLLPDHVGTTQGLSRAPQKRASLPATGSGPDKVCGDDHGSHFTRIPISFLLQYTDPHNSRIHQYFPSLLKSDDDGFPPSVSQAKSPVGSESPFDLYEDPSGWNWTIAGHTESLEQFLGLDILPIESWDCGDGVRCSPSQGPNVEHPLIEQRMGEVLSELGSHNEMDSLGPYIRVIFCKTRVQALVQSYFTSWHPHCPILRKPSFDAVSVFPPLLAAVMMVGATYYSEETAEAADNCLEAVEHYVFEHEAFRRLLDPAEAEAVSTDIAPLQAAFIIAILLHWNNYSASRRRVRLHRYADLVAAARNLGLPSHRHSDGAQAGMPTSEREWDIFFRAEEAIRLVNWIFLVDSSHAIFHRAPPKLTLSEMTGNFPCSDELFAASDSSLQQQQSWHRAFPKLDSIAEGMSLLMQDSWTDELLAVFEHLGYQGFFILVSGLHEIIFSAEAACSLAAVKPAVDRALTRWKLLWDLHTQDVPQDAGGRFGFYENAGEYWWLAKLFLDKGTPSTAEEGGKVFDQDSMEDVNGFVRRLAEMRIE
ncbi:hypothetical protein BN1708_011316 [Verticillium longisporum]|uniref:Zn(2)-C6 fungal-type domain-containing protein n=1 Tax=Verticillium longisporum TaxID=100787 RepID=A0A0G4KZ53_VERLO|nr:hypothetical protein BN1708_011316 [Verticillium longisporum]